VVVPVTSEESQKKVCHRCGDDASLSAADQNGVFRDICRDCFESHHYGRSPPDWRDALLMGGVVMAGLLVDIVAPFTAAVSVVALLLFLYFAVTMASGAYPWSMRP
jgi:hypothetical protein